MAPTPALVILSLGIDKLSHKYRTIFMHILSAARLLIMREWRQDLTPNVFDVKLQVNLVRSYEECLAIESQSYKKFDDTWNFWPTP